MGFPAGGHRSGMTTTAAARVQRARDSKWLEALTRGGFIGYGILHLALTWLTVQIAVYHHSGHSADQSGAFKLIEQQPLGRALLILIAVGLAAMCVWQLLLAIAGHHDEKDDGARTKARLGSAGLTIAYGVLCGTCVKVLAGDGKSSSSSQHQSASTVLSHPWGQALIAIVGLGVVGGGVGMIVYGVKASFEKKLDLGTAGRNVRRAVMFSGRTGYAGKGLAFGIVGVLLLVSAFRDSAARAKGLDGALHTLAGHAYGTVLLAIVALGFFAYGLYAIAQSRYRRV